MVIYMGQDKVGQGKSRIGLDEVGLGRMVA